MDIDSFYSSTISELFFVIEGYERRIKGQYNITYAAVYNAVGVQNPNIKKGKFKYIDLFGDEQTSKKVIRGKKVEKTKWDSEVAYLKSLNNSSKG